MMALPLHYGDHVFGTLIFYYRRPRTFTEGEKSAASLLANLAAAAIGTADLYQDQRQRAEDQNFVAEASELLASSLDYETTLANLATLAVPRFADWCTIDVVGDEASIERLTVAHVDPDKVQWANELAEKYPPDPDAPYGVPNVIRTGRPSCSRKYRRSPCGRRPRTLPSSRRPSRRWASSRRCVSRSSPGAHARRDHLRLGGERPALQRRRSRDRPGPRPPRGDRDRQCAALPRRPGRTTDSQESLAVVDAVFAAAPVGLAFMNTKFRYVRVNDALAALNGRPVDDHLGRTLRDVVGDDAGRRDRAVPPPRPRDERADPRPPRPARRSNNPTEIRSWLVSYYPVRDVTTSRSASASSSRTFTEREKARAAAEAPAARLSVLAEMSSLLASSLDYETTLANVAQLIVPQFADWCAVDIVARGRLDRAHRGRPQGSREGTVGATARATCIRPIPTSRRARRASSGPASRCSTGASPTSSSQQTAPGPENLEVLRELGHGVGDGRADEGARPHARRADARLRRTRSGSTTTTRSTFAEHLGRRAATAVDNALLYRRSEQRAQAARALALRRRRRGARRRGRDRPHLERGGGGDHRPAGARRRRSPGRRGRSRLGIDRGARPRRRWPRHSARRDRAARARRAASAGCRSRASSLPGGTVYAFRDLTEERRVERLKSEFVSTISHELRTPLAAIYGAALTLRREESDSASQREGLLDVVADESERLARIVNDILWVSRLESGHACTSPSRAATRPSSLGVVAAARCPPAGELTLTLESRRTCRRSRPTPTRCARSSRTCSTTRSSTRRTAATFTLAHRRTRRRVRALRGRRRGPRRPACGARPDLREVLPPRPGADARRRRHGPRPLHLRELVAPHERPHQRRVEEGDGSTFKVELPVAARNGRRQRESLARLITGRFRRAHPPAGTRGRARRRRARPVCIAESAEHFPRDEVWLRRRRSCAGARGRRRRPTTTRRSSRPRGRRSRR